MENSERLKTAVMNTLKAGRSPRETRAMFAKMGSSGSLQGKGPSGKRTGDPLPPTGQAAAPTPTKQTAATDEEIDSFLRSVGSPDAIEQQIQPPDGRAPTGQGKEYQVKRWLGMKMDTLIERRDKLQQILSEDTGTTTNRRRYTRAKNAIQAINEAVNVSRHVMQNLLDAGIPFSDGKSIFNDIFGSVAAYTGGV